MQVSTILAYIDNGHIALPEFQRGYVWTREQVRGLFDSLYRRHPVGGLLVWATGAGDVEHRGDQQLAPGVVKLLLDGQQRMTSLYGVIRGRAPEFFDGNAQCFTGLRFHVAREEFQFHQPITMRDDPLWIDVSGLFKRGNDGIGELAQQIAARPEHTASVGIFMGRLNRLLGIQDIDFHIEEITGREMTLDVVVDIFNKVNSGGTKLSKGDLALAKICADWPQARESMKNHLSRWRGAGYDFTLDWLLRSVNTVLTGEAKFLHLHDQSAEDVQGALHRAASHVDTCLNMIAGRLGLDHDRVLFGRGGISVMARYLEQRGASLTAVERDKLLFWYVSAAMWGRFSGSVESFIDADLEALEGTDEGLDQLLRQLRLWHGGLRVEAAHFDAWSLGARFYPVLYMLTRMGDARDLGTGLPLKANLLGKMNRLEVHHIFPKARLYTAEYDRTQVNALANFCFLTKDSNLEILASLPERYFEEVEARHPGALASQWIPTDRALWRLDRYPDFLQARRELLSSEANRRLGELLHDDQRWLDASSPVGEALVTFGGINSEDEEAQLRELNKWVAEQGLAEGIIAFELTDQTSGEQRAVLDLAWPQGVQSELSEPIAVLLDETAELLSVASANGFRCFTTAAALRSYVVDEVFGPRESEGYLAIAM